MQRCAARGNEYIDAAKEALDAAIKALVANNSEPGTGDGNGSGTGNATGGNITTAFIIYLCGFVFFFKRWLNRYLDKQDEKRAAKELKGGER